MALLCISVRELLVQQLSQTLCFLKPHVRILYTVAPDMTGGSLGQRGSGCAALRTQMLLTGCQQHARRLL